MIRKNIKSGTLANGIRLPPKLFTNNNLNYWSNRDAERHGGTTLLCGAVNRNRVAVGECSAFYTLAIGVCEDI